MKKEENEKFLKTSISPVEGGATILDSSFACEINLKPAKQIDLHFPAVLCLYFKKALSCPSYEGKRNILKIVK